MEQPSNLAPAKDEKKGASVAISGNNIYTARDSATPFFCFKFISFE
jgi:hypothetical protein